MSHPHEPLDRVVERLLDGDHHSRREFVRRLGATGAVTSARRPPGRLRRGVGHREQAGQGRRRAAGEPPEDRDRDARRVQLAALHRQEDAAGLAEGREREAQLHRGHQRERRVLRQGPPAARGGPGHRPRPRRARPTGWPRAGSTRGYTEKIDKRNVPNAKNLLPALQHPGFDRNRDYTLPWQSGITAIGYNPKKTGGRLTSINDLFDPRFKGRVVVHLGLARLGQPRPAGHGQEDRHGDQGRPPGGDREARQGQQERPDPPVHRQRLRQGPRRWATSGPAPPTPATSSSCSPTTRSSSSSCPEEGAVTWSDNMMIPTKAKHPYGAETWMNYYYDPAGRREARRLRELLLPGAGREGGPRSAPTRSSRPTR